MKPTAPWVALLRALVLLMFSAPAAATATLTGSFMNAVCGITGPLGTTTVPCRQSTGGVDFQASLNPGETAFLDATLHFDYRDDGLRLAPGHPGFVQLDAAGDHVRDLFVEAGVIYLFSNFCQGRHCSFPPGVDASGTIGFPPIVLGENENPTTSLRTSLSSPASSCPAGRPLASAAPCSSAGTRWRSPRASSPFPNRTRGRCS